MTKSEALRLADLIASDFDPDWMSEQGYDQIAAELRRLHAENEKFRKHIEGQNKELDQLIPMAEKLETENERLHQINRSHEMKVSVRGYEIQLADLAAQRDALLEALKFVIRGVPDTWEGVQKAKAAIKAAEENT